MAPPLFMPPFKHGLQKPAKLARGAASTCSGDSPASTITFRDPVLRNHYITNNGM